MAAPAFFASVLIIGAAPVTAAPADTLAALGAALSACTSRIEVPMEAAGSEITVLLSLTRRGALNGRPRITYSRLVGVPATRRAFVAAELAGLAGCLPLTITDGLGRAVAGRPLRLLLRASNRELAI